MRLGERVRALRLANGWTQAQLAERLGWPRTVVVRLETGTDRDPRASTLQEISDAFGIDVADLLAGVDFSKKPLAPG